MKNGANVIFSTAARKGSGGSSSDARDDYQTPRPLFAGLDTEFAFGLDAAASAHNALCKVWISERQNALVVPWYDELEQDERGSVFCNPPYSLLDGFVRRAAEQAAEHDLTAVLLIPARTGRAIWRTYVWNRAHEIRFISGRLSFGLPDKPTTTATFDSAVVVYRGRQRLRRTECFWIDREGTPI